MLKFIKNLLNHKSSDTKEESSANNSITFIIDKDNNLYIYVSAFNLEEKDSKNFADMLHGICGGQYTQNILSILLDLGKEDTKINKFVNSTIDEWATMCGNKAIPNTTSLNNNEPMIKPTVFFKGLINNRHE